MKKIIKLITLSAILLMLAGEFISCKGKENDCEIIFCDPPADMKPIDWEGYNDVYSTYWNFAINGGGNSFEQFKQFKIFGRVQQMDLSAPEGSVDRFYLYDFDYDDEPYVGDRPYLTRIEIRVKNTTTADSLYHKFAKTDLTKKCYIRGTIWGLHVDPFWSCARWVREHKHLFHLDIKYYCDRYNGLIAQVEVSSADDIYFE
jgi:hypothetical protein